MKKNLCFLMLGVISGIVAMFVGSHVRFEERTYVKTEEGTWLPYAFDENYIGEETSVEDSNEATKMFFKIFVGNNKYCYAAYAPHGAMWQASCFKTEKECNKDLKENEFRTLNTKKCYQPYLTNGWCLESVNLGVNRFYDDNTYGEMIADVCTKTKESCEKLVKYKRFHKDSGCRKLLVASHHSFETNYLWPEKEVERIIKDNEKSSPLELKNKTKLIWK